jgi:hypothetical protein
MLTHAKKSPEFVWANGPILVNLRHVMVIWFEDVAKGDWEIRATCSDGRTVTLASGLLSASDAAVTMERLADRLGAIHVG